MADSKDTCRLIWGFRKAVMLFLACGGDFVLSRGSMRPIRPFLRSILFRKNIDKVFPRAA
jgi:hypothetical protein